MADSEIESQLSNNDASSAKAETHWYDSRSVQQLADRLEGLLKNGGSIGEMDDEQKAAIEQLFKAASMRDDQAEKMALALALLYGGISAGQRGWFGEMVVRIGSEAVLWDNVEKCAEITDRMPGKQSRNWFDVLCLARGGEYLVRLVFRLPHRLWAVMEKAMHDMDPHGTMMKDAVRAELAANRVTADLLYWLWKCRDADMAELREKYLSDSALLFKTLHQDMKGNYLKAQRDMRKLLLDDPVFQDTLCRNGDHTAVVELIRCTKRLSLLDPDERQSLLVKIFNLYPQFKSDIEEKRKGPARVSVGRMTSRHGYNRRRAELDHLVNVDIPENTKAIETARAHGDLRENSEFKFAKERQRFLGQRRREWEESLVGLRVTDFSDTHIDKVIIPGCTVVLKHDDGRVESIHLLGMLDSETEKDIISYDTPLGKLLLGNEAGAEITLPSGSKATIEEVRPLSAEMLAYIAE